MTRWSCATLKGDRSPSSDLNSRETVLSPNVPQVTDNRVEEAKNPRGIPRKRSTSFHLSQKGHYEQRILSTDIATSA